jgi:DNA-directed RNA polymerase specialized sigma24 family protein
MRRLAYRAAYRLLGERTAAEGVAGEALARAYSRWSSVSGHAEAWVVTVATNTALDVGRKRARAASRQLDPELFVAFFDVANIYTRGCQWKLVDPAPGPTVDDLVAA